MIKPSSRTLCIARGIATRALVDTMAVRLMTEVAVGAAKTILWISDIHIDPYYGTNIVCTPTGYLIYTSTSTITPTLSVQISKPGR